MLSPELFNDFVSKPIDVQYITSVVRKWLPGELINIDPLEGPITDETFDDLLKDFYLSIEANAVLYRELLSNNDLGNFRLEMQKVVEIGKKIAADNLSDKALELEALCNNAGLDAVKENYETFEKYYLGFKDKLEVILKRKKLID